MSKICAQLHQYFNSLPLYHYPFDDKRIPLNGIYVLFEKGEHAHAARRIVRIGTHTGENQLRARLKQHFVKENKDRSIFRKNIGRALLNRANDSFLDLWEIDLTTTEARRRHTHLVDSAEKQQVEKEVSAYMRDNFCFAAVRMDDRDRRLFWESKIISTISLCRVCVASKNWVGQFSPKTKIKESGLWLVNHLYKEPLSEAECDEFLSLMAASSKN